MTDATLAVHSPNPGDRRVAGDRRSLEFLVETLLRPGNWAASLAYSLGLQGRLRTSTMTLDTSATPVAGSSGRRPPLRIGFASDFHAGAMTDGRRLAEACHALTALRPDVLLLGGDFVSARGSDIDRIAPLLAAIPAPLGKFTVLGNHDLHANSALIVAGLERAGIRVIANQHVALPSPFGDISICGLDDQTRGHPRADLALDDATGIRIVLMHSPDGLEAIGRRPFDLALCGHTHGGQIAFPWGAPLVVPGGATNRQYCAGRYCVGGDGPALLVSHGVGCSGVPIRMFAAPEVHLCLIT